MVVRRPAVFAELSVLRITEPVPCLRRVVVVGMLITLPVAIVAGEMLVLTITLGVTPLFIADKGAAPLVP